jgi:hypothetical protein
MLQFIMAGLVQKPPGLSFHTEGALRVTAAIFGAVLFMISEENGKASQPFFTTSLANRTNLVLSGGGGAANGAYFIFSSTNPALLLANWTMIGGSNFFDASGNFAFTNVLASGRPAQYFTLSLSPQTLSAADAMVLSALQNMRDEGFNTYLATPGGLYINWNYTNNPPVAATNVNIESNGKADASTTLRHDRLTDIVYLAALCLYKQGHPLEPQFDSEVAKYTTICLSSNDDNFAGSPDERGWIYWVLEDIIPTVPAFKGVDDAQADHFYSQYTKNLGKYPGVTPLYLDFPTNEPGGEYTVANEIEDGCVLIVNGAKRGLANYIAAGENLLAFQQSNSWSTNLLLWPENMGHVFTDGTKTQIAPPSAEYIYDAVIKPGELGEATEAICRANQADPGHNYGAWAAEILDNLQPSVNGYKLWDMTNGGYYLQLQFTGSTNIYSTSLSYTVDKSYKEVGRFTVVVRAFLAANQTGIASYNSNTLATINAAAQSSYYSAGHGWPYQEYPNWTLYNNPVLQTWVTSESTGHATRSILSYELAQ